MYLMLLMYIIILYKPYKEVYVSNNWVTAGYAGQQFTCILWVEYAKIAVITPNRWDFYVD